MRPSVYLILSLLLLSCSGSSQTNKAKDIPVVNQMLEEFRQQEHRLEFNGCEMKYNGTPFHLGMTIEELDQVLGEHLNFGNGIFAWQKIGIVIIGKAENNFLDNISEYIYISI